MTTCTLAAPGNLIARLLIGLQASAEIPAIPAAVLVAERALFWPTVKRVFLLIIVIGLSLCSAIQGANWR